MSLGTGHKVFTRGCGGYSRGVRKKIRTFKGGGTKILVGGYQNISRRLPKPRGGTEKN